MNNTGEEEIIQHQWHFDWPWEFAGNYQHWFYMVDHSTYLIEDWVETYLHVRVFGLRSSWLIRE